MININNSFQDKDFGTICVCAVRYALGRRTYMPSLVQDFIIRNIKYIDSNSIVVMIRDIEQADSYGDEIIDKPGWMSILSFLKRNNTK